MAELKFERLAMANAPMPDGLSLEDQSAYQFLALLYDRYHRKQITREQAAEEKGRMLYQLDLRKRSAEFDRKMVRWHTQLIKAAEIANMAYRKNRTLENADKLVNILDGLEKVNVDGIEEENR